MLDAVRAPSGRYRESNDAKVLFWRSSDPALAATRRRNRRLVPTCIIVAVSKINERLSNWSRDARSSDPANPAIHHHSNMHHSNATMFGGGGRGGNAPGGVDIIDLCSDDDGGSDVEVQVVQVNRPAGIGSSADGAAGSGRPTVTGVAAAASASAGGGGAAAAGSKPKFVPKPKAKSKAGAQKKADGPPPSRKRPAESATSKRPTKTPPSAAGMALLQGNSLVFGGKPADDNTDPNKRKKRKYNKSRSRSASPATASAASYNTNAERKRPAFGAMCKEMGRYLQSIANGRGWLAMDPDLAAWANEQRAEYARFLEYKKTERPEMGNGSKRKRRRGGNRPQMTEEMVEKLREIGFDLDVSTGMTPPRKLKSSSPFHGTTEGSTSVSAKSSDKKESRQARRRRRKREKKEKCLTASEDDGKKKSSIARDSGDDGQEKSPLRVFNDPGDPVLDIEIANQSESEDGDAGIGGEDEDDSRVDDEDFAFNYIPLVERIVMLDSETNLPLSPSKQPLPRTIGMQPIMTPPREERAQDVTEERKPEAKVCAKADQKETPDKTASGPDGKESVHIASGSSASSSSAPTAPPIQRDKTKNMEEKMSKGFNESSSNDQNNSHDNSVKKNCGDDTKKSSDDNKSISEDAGSRADEVLTLKAEVDALRAQLEEERRRRERAEAVRRHNSTNIVSGGEEEAGDSKECALPAKVRAEVVEINDNSDEAADKSSKPSANDATQTPASKPQEGSIPGTQQVDQRMNNAVKTILSYPEVVPYDALCAAGYVFEEIEAVNGPTLVDQNGISLERRKEELNQSVLSEKKKAADEQAKKPASFSPIPSNPYAKKKKPVQASPMANSNAKATPSVPVANPYAKPAQTSFRASLTSSATTNSKTTDRTDIAGDGREATSKQCSTCKEVHPQFRFSNEQWVHRSGYCHKCMVTERQRQAQTHWPPRQDAQWLHRRDRNSEKKKSSSAHRHQDYLYSQQEQQERLFREAAERVKQQQRIAQQQQQQHPASSSWTSASGNWVRAGPSYSAPVDDINKLPANHWTWPDSHARLGLPKNATIAQIKKQFRKMALKYHPDKNSGSRSLQAWHAIKEAYEKISS